MEMPRESLGLRAMPCCSLVLNPDSSHRRSYVPGNTLLNVNAPRSSVLAVRIALVPVFTSVAVAPWSTAPLASSTLPRNVAVVPLTCAEDVVAGSDSSRSSRPDRLRERRVLSPSERVRRAIAIT